MSAQAKPRTAKENVSKKRVKKLALVTEKKTKKMSRSERSKLRKEQVLAVLKSLKGRSTMTYGELAKEIGTMPMAIGQILKGLDNDGHSKLTKKIVSKKAANK